MNYPKVIDYDIYCGDPAEARQLIDAGLEAKGLVQVDRTQKLKDVGKPIVHFRAGASPFFLVTSKEDKAINVQKVKVAELALDKVTSIVHDQNLNIDIVTYTTVYKNLTPFAALLKNPLTKPITHKAYFNFFENGWVMDTRK